MPMLPFRIDFSERSIDDLHRRIDATRWPEIPYETGWSTGTHDRVLRDLVRYWRTEYDWRAAQDRLNRLAHLRGPIEGPAEYPGTDSEEMHCVLYAGPGSERRLPLLLLHGWPGSFIEFLDAAERLAAGVDGGPAFDVVVPSLPGFAFSQAPRAPGMHPGRIAERMHLLMRELGYERYGVQGGDWGGIIGPALAARHPEAVVGLHVNFGGGRAGPGESEEMSEAEREGASSAAAGSPRRPATAGCSAPARRRSPTRSTTPRSACSRGSSRNSGPGATMAQTMVGTR
jgi:pimeloyl-ACP methyl ester carboxylesterase